MIHGRVMAFFLPSSVVKGLLLASSQCWYCHGDANIKSMLEKFVLRLLNGSQKFSVEAKGTIKSVSFYQRHGILFQRITPRIRFKRAI